MPYKNSGFVCALTRPLSLKEVLCRHSWSACLYETTYHVLDEGLVAADIYKINVVVVSRRNLRSLWSAFSTDVCVDADVGMHVWSKRKLNIFMRHKLWPGFHDRLQCGQVIDAVVSAMISPSASYKTAELRSIMMEEPSGAATPDFPLMFSELPEEAPLPGTLAPAWSPRAESTRAAWWR